MIVPLARIVVKFTSRAKIIQGGVADFVIGRVDRAKLLASGMEEPPRRGDDRPRIRDRKLQAVIVIGVAGSRSRVERTRGKLHSRFRSVRASADHATTLRVFRRKFSDLGARASAKCLGEFE